MCHFHTFWKKTQRNCLGIEYPSDWRTSLLNNELIFNQNSTRWSTGVAFLELANTVSWVNTYKLGKLGKVSLNDSVNQCYRSEKDRLSLLCIMEKNKLSFKTFRTMTKGVQHKFSCKYFSLFHHLMCYYVSLQLFHHFFIDHRNSY